jgi:hypothetical protein
VQSESAASDGRANGKKRTKIERGAEGGRRRRRRRRRRGTPRSW